MKNALLHDGLAYWARHDPDKPALMLDQDEPLSYGALARWSDGIAEHLQRIGVVAGDRVGIIGGNSYDWVAGAFGILKAGGILVPLNERFMSGELEHLLQSTTPSAIICEEQRLAQLSPIAGLPPLVMMADLAACREGAAPGWTAVRVPSDAIAQIIFTSGTTSRPKGVMISHEQLLAKYCEMHLMLPGFGSRDIVMMMAVGLQGGLGTTWGYLFTTTHGGTMTFMRRFDPALALRIMTERGVTIMPGFPLLFDQISRQPDFATADLSALDIAVVGGSRIPAEMLATWRDKGVLLRSMYGLTEGGNYVSIASEAEVREGRTSCGPPMLYTRVRLLREGGGECAVGEPGEILVQGPGMMIGYWGNAAATAEALVDGWLHTGDIGVIDADGYLSFVDRAKDMVITGGFNVSPSEVEAVITELPGVAEVGVFAIPDAKFGEVPAAYVTVSGPLSQQQVFEHCRARLAGFKLPRYIVIGEEPLPRIPNGKIDKKALAAAHRDAPERLCKHLSRTEQAARAEGVA